MVNIHNDVSATSNLIRAPKYLLKGVGDSTILFTVTRRRVMIFSWYNNMVTLLSYELYCKMEFMERYLLLNIIQ